MKMINTNFLREIFLLAAILILFSSCATHRVDWNARVGNYTMDQAIMDFGPPDKQAKLSDGKTVDEWISHYSSGGYVGVSTGIYGAPYGGGFVEASGPTYYESKLQLTFETNRVLTAWSKK
jgi:hypothetical protein